MSDDMNRPDKSSAAAGEEAVAAQMKAMLGTVVAQTPEPPSVAAISVRIDRLGADHQPSRLVTSGGDGHSDVPIDEELPLYPVGETEPGGSAGRDRFWSRAALIAAALIAVVAIGVVAIGGDDDASDTNVAEQPDRDGRVVMVPDETPAGHWVDGIHSGTSDQGDRFAAVHYDALGTGTLRVESVEVDPSEVDLVADAQRSGSLERWGDREVVVDEDGRTAQFVDPAGVQVLVQGDPGVVRDVVPTLQVLDGSAWRDFVGAVGAEVEALPMTAAFDLNPNDLATGSLAFEEVTVGPDQVRISVHHDPSGEGNVKAGSCLTVDDTTVCRPGAALNFDVPGGMQTSFEVLVDGDWWHFGWSTNQLTGVEVTPSEGTDGSPVRWAYEGTGHGDSMSWWVSVLPDDTNQIEVELTYPDTGSGFHELRPAD